MTLSKDPSRPTARGLTRWLFTEMQHDLP